MCKHEVLRKITKDKYICLMCGYYFIVKKGGKVKLSSLKRSLKLLIESEIK